MTNHIKGQCRTQATLFPEVLDDFVSEDNPVRIVDAFVNELDLQELGFERVQAKSTGRPGYHPAILSGLATLIGRNDFSDTDISGIDGLAWLDTTPSEMDSVPAPASSALLGLGLVAIGFFRKKKLNSSN